jgi:hypothetical protein
MKIKHKIITRKDYSLNIFAGIIILGLTVPFIFFSTYCVKGILYQIIDNNDFNNLISCGFSSIVVLYISFENRIHKWLEPDEYKEVIHIIEK